MSFWIISQQTCYLKKKLKRKVSSISPTCDLQNLYFIYHYLWLLFSPTYPVKYKNTILLYERLMRLTSRKKQMRTPRKSTFWAPSSAPNPSSYPLEACLSNTFFNPTVINVPFLLKLAQVGFCSGNQNNSNEYNRLLENFLEPFHEAMNEYITRSSTRT